LGGGVPSGLALTMKYHAIAALCLVVDCRAQDCNAFSLVSSKFVVSDLSREQSGGQLYG